jgi:hypothetical protein
VHVQNARRQLFDEALFGGPAGALRHQVPVAQV